MLAVVGQHLVAALHRADRRFEHGRAGVTEALSGKQIGLLAHDAFAAHFLDHVAVGIGDDPMSCQKPRGNLAFVADGDGVREDVMPFVRLRLLADIIGADVDADLVAGRC
jgi:hypothetical protein